MHATLRVNNARESMQREMDEAAGVKVEQRQLNKVDRPKLECLSDDGVAIRARYPGASVALE